MAVDQNQEARITMCAEKESLQIQEYVKELLDTLFCLGRRLINHSRRKGSWSNLWWCSPWWWSSLLGYPLQKCQTREFITCKPSHPGSLWGLLRRTKGVGLSRYFGFKLELQESRLFCMITVAAVFIESARHARFKGKGTPQSLWIRR